MTLAKRELPETRSLAMQIADELRKRIVSGELLVSERLPSEAEIADEFGVSQPTVREAMKILAAKKLVRSKRGPNGGMFVNKPSLSVAGQMLQETTAWFVGTGVFGLGDIVETRLMLGRICVGLAAERATSADIEKMEATLQSWREERLSDEEFCQLDVAFHDAIAEATKNNELQFIMLIVNDALIPATNMISFQFRERGKVIGLHEEILKAVSNGEKDRAVAAFDELIGYQSRVYDSALEAREKGGLRPGRKATRPKGR